MEDGVRRHRNPEGDGARGPRPRSPRRARLHPPHGGHLQAAYRLQPDGGVCRRHHLRSERGELHRAAATVLHGLQPARPDPRARQALSKKLLAYHRIPVPDFTVVRRGRRTQLSKKLRFPLIVKSLFFEASTGISQASVVENEEQLERRVQFVHESLGSAAIVEQFIDGRELYVGVVGNQRLDVFPVWEMSFDKMPENRWHIATERVKWSTQYQKRHGIMTEKAALDAATTQQIQRIAKRTCRALDLSGYARIDLRLDEEARRVYVLEANPNPNLAYGEDFAESAEVSGVSYERLLERILALGLRWEPERT